MVIFRIALVYVENTITEYLDRLLPLLVSLMQEDKSEILSVSIKKSAEASLELIGRFCPSDSFLEILLSFIKMERSKNELNFIYSIEATQKALKGHFECLPSGPGLLDKKDTVGKLLIELGSTKWLDLLSKSSLEEFNQMAFQILDFINKKSSKEEVNS